MAPKDSGNSTDTAPEGAALTIIVVFLTMSFYNVIELSCIILATFKRRSGLYFWSFVVATWAIAVYSIGFLVKAVRPETPGWAYMSLVVPGWCCMVTGQSVVLYSRLHIVMRNPSRLRLVLIMIITNAFIGHVPTAVFAYGANTPNPGPFIIPYSIYERVQVTLFFLQEMVISALYIHETVGLMRVRRRANMDSSRQGSGKRRLLMAHLVVVNVLIVVLDITILGLEYAGLYAVQTAYKGFVYSVKLKLEFSILNRLVEMTQGGSSSGHESSYARTAADMSGVRMEKLDGDSTDRERKKNRRSVAAADLNNSLGNNVFVGVGAGGPAVAGAEEARHNGASVVMTTEVTIQRDRLYLESDVEADRESLGGRSGVTEDSIVGGNGGQARAPSHSSQRHIVDERYS